MPSTTRPYQKLYQIASEQDGYFTTKQAIHCGYRTSSHPYHIKAGNRIREYRSIFRLANFPTGDRPDLILWYLWSRNRNGEPQGIYSHETSLSLHDLTDISPAKLHMTVPKGFRRNSLIPGVLVLHYSDVPASEVDQMYGVRITNPIRTLIDIVEERVLSDDILRQAFFESINRGIVTKKVLLKAGQTNHFFNDFINQLKL